MTTYARRKAAAREYAQDWQAEFCENSYTWEDVAAWESLYRSWALT